MTDRLKNKVALVTGIGAGIGREIALLFAREGALVVGCDISSQRAEAVEREAKRLGLELRAVHPLDLRRPEAVAQYITAALQAHGRIEILVNAAAITPHLAPTAQMDYVGQWSPTMVGEVDLVFLAVQAAWPHLRVQGGSIINFASVAALRAGGPGMVAHCAGKAAVLAMSRQMALEGGPHGIRCNTIAPGWVETAASEAVKSATGASDERILQRLIIKRLGAPSDIAYGALFLASDESSWVTGTNLCIDGGTMAN